MACSDRFRWSAEIRRDPGSLVSAVGVSRLAASSSRTVGSTKCGPVSPSSSGRQRQRKTAAMRGGCCTRLLYNGILVAQTRIGLRSPRGLPIKALHPAQRTPRDASRPHGQASRHTEGCQAGPPGHASGQQCRLRDGAVAEYETTSQAQLAGLPSRHLHGKTPHTGSGCQVPTHYLAK